MKLMYATVLESLDIHNWSGLGFYYAKMLREAGFTDLKCLNLNEKNLVIKLIQLLEVKYKFMFGKNSPTLFGFNQSEAFAKVIYSKIDNTTHVLSANTAILAHLKNDLKKILYTDSTLDNLLNFYPNYSYLDKETITEAQELELHAIKNTDMLIYTSQWAADSAINKYGADPEKVFIVPFGANLKLAPGQAELKSIIEKRRLVKHINLLFVGMEWERKGGDHAVAVAEKLNRIGIPAKLNIAGIKKLSSHINSEYIVNHGFISKRTGKGERKLCNLIAQSDYLVLPSLADCTPIVLSEANAFGVPCLVSDVGGNPDIIKYGINGRTFPLSNFVEDAVNYIVQLQSNRNEYEQLCFSSHNEYEKELNWKTTGAKIYKLINSI